MVPKAEASKELLNNLAMAAASLTKFQQLAFPAACSAASVLEIPSNSFHAVQLHQPTTTGVQTHFSPEHRPRIGKKRLFTELEEETPFSPRTRTHTPTDESRSRSGSSEDSCCGGYVDCEALRHDGILEDRDGGISRISGMRSTSDYPT